MIAQPSQIGSRSVRSIGMQLTWMFAARPASPLTAGIDATNRMRKRASCACAPEIWATRGKPTLIHQHMVFAAEFAAIVRVSARVLASSRCR